MTEKRLACLQWLMIWEPIFSSMAYIDTAEGIYTSSTN
jgi:hypothetical protein